MTDYWLLVTVPPEFSMERRGYTYTAQPHPLRLLTDDDAQKWAELYLKGIGGGVGGQLFGDGIQILQEIEQ
jgi:hypothetical protein